MNIGLTFSFLPYEFLIVCEESLNGGLDGIRYVLIL
jgi:hypothetical protein